MARAKAMRTTEAARSYGYERTPRTSLYMPAPAEAYAAAGVAGYAPAGSLRRRKQAIELSAKQFIAIVFVIVLVSAVALVYIFLAAQKAVVQNEINDLEYRVAQADEEIAGIQVGIEQGQNIQLVRQKAKDELGMSEPSLDRNIYVNEIAVPETGVAQMIRDAAYGSG